jgi:hypothetical protein
MKVSDLSSLFGPLETEDGKPLFEDDNMQVNALVALRLAGKEIGINALKKLMTEEEWKEKLALELVDKPLDADEDNDVKHNEIGFGSLKKLGLEDIVSIAIPDFVMPANPFGGSS